MKYLNKFSLINENVAQAKAFLKKIKISELDPDFIKIKDMLKGHEGYVFWFTKLRFSDNQPIAELNDVWNIINDNSGLVNYFTKKVVELDSLESFWDQYERAKLFSGAKNVLNKFPANQKRFFKLDNEEDFNLLVSLSKSKSLPALIRKISSFKDKATLVASAKMLLTSSFDGKFGELFKLAEDIGANIEVSDEENNIIVCSVNYEQIRKLGGDTSWCITRAKSTFDSYASGGFQWVILLVDNFGKNDRLSKIGLTTHFGYTAAHDKYDGHIPEVKLAQILSERGVNIRDFYMSKENLISMPDWDLVSVELLSDNKISKSEIIKKKLIFKEKNRYNRQTVSKNDIDFFTDEEIKKWGLEERIEVSWEYITSLDKEEIIKKGLINRLIDKSYIKNIINILNISSSEIIDHEIYKLPQVLIIFEDMFDVFSKEEIIKYKIFNYTQGFYLNKMFEKGFSKEEIIDHEIYKIANINSETLSYFKKDELIKYKIIDRANNIPYDVLLSCGFNKDEIFKKYSNILNSITKAVIKFFEGKTKSAIKSRLGTTFWNDDIVSLGIDKSELYKFKLLSMSLYDINFDMIGFDGLENILGSEITIEKSNIETLKTLGFKITNKDTFLKMINLFKTGYGIKLLSSIISYRKLFDKEELAFDLCTNYLNQTLINNSYNFDYFDFMLEKQNLICPEYNQIIEVFKQKRKKKYYLSTTWDIKTPYSKESGYGSYDFKNTVAFMKELNFNKEDILELGIRGFANIFQDIKDDDKVDKLINLINSYDIKLDENAEMIVIEGIVGVNSNSDHKDKDITHSEEYYIEFIKRNFKLEDSLKGLLLHFKKNKKLTSTQEILYRDYFKKGGSKYIELFEKELKGIKLIESHSNCLKDLNLIFRYDSNKKIEDWYDKNFKIYKDIQPLAHRFEKPLNDIKVMWLLASLNKLDEFNNFYKWDMSSPGFSFDNNILHSVCKLLSKVGNDYDRYFKYIKLSEYQIRDIYELILKNVDETEYWVKKYLIVCYYLYDKEKFDNFLNEILTIKNNYKYHKDAIKTLRIDGIRYILKYLVNSKDTDTIKILLDKILSMREKSTPRINKMTKVEFNSTLEYIESLGAYNREIRDFLNNYIDEAKNKFENIKESFIIRWCDF